MCFLLEMLLYPCQHSAVSDHYTPCDYARLHPGWTILDAIRCAYFSAATLKVPRCNLCPPPATSSVHAHAHTHIQHATRDISSASAGRRRQHDHHQYSNKLHQAPHQYQYRDNITYSSNTTSNQPTTSTRSPIVTRDARRVLIAEVGRLAIQRSQRIERLLSPLPRLNTSLPHPYSDLRFEPGEDSKHRESHGRLPSLPSSRNRIYSSSPYVSTRPVDLTTPQETAMQPDQHTPLLNRRRSRRRSRRSRTSRSSPNLSIPIVETTRTNLLPIMQQGVERRNQPTWPLGTLWNNSGRQMREHRSAPPPELRPVSLVVAEDDDWPKSGNDDRDHRQHQNAVRTFIPPIRERVPYSNANSRRKSA